jgi:putative membrane protein
VYDGTLELKDGAARLYDGTAELADGAIELKDGTAELHDGTIELRDGTFEFRDKTAGLDVKLTDKIRAAVKDVLGGDFNPVSFVSSKNTNVEAVQFVMKTPAIEKPAPIAPAPARPEKPSLWRKFIALFDF